MHDAIQTLMDEHRVIEQVLGALETYADRLEAGETLDRTAAAKFADFFKNFADRCHHGKEEDRLFAQMERNGFPKEYGPLAVMLAEHVEGRSHVGALAAAGEGSGVLSAAEREGVLAHARAYVPLLRNHILKEDNILYPMALQAIRNEEMDTLARDFERFEEEAMGEGAHARYHALAEELVATYPPDPARMASASACFGCAGHV